MNILAISFAILLGVLAFLLVWYKVVDIYFNRKQKFYCVFIAALGNMLSETGKKINELGGKKNVE